MFVHNKIIPIICTHYYPGSQPVALFKGHTILLQVYRIYAHNKYVGKRTYQLYILLYNIDLFVCNIEIALHAQDTTAIKQCSNIIHWMIEYIYNGS